MTFRTSSFAAASIIAAWVGSGALSIVAASTQATQGSRSVLDGVYTEEQAKRGAPLYAQQCSSCHGQTLEGLDMAPGLTGGTFVSNWNGLTVGDIFERIRLTMPQDDPGKLSRQQDADIVAYLLQVNKYPAGKSELPLETEVLKQIKFEPTKGSH